MEGAYYVRLKSSLTGRRFWKDRAFGGSRKSCSRFGEGNRLASRLYRMVDREKKQYSLFCFLKRRAIHLLKGGNSLEQSEAMLVDYLTSFGLISKEETEEKTHTPGVRVRPFRKVRDLPLKRNAVKCLSQNFQTSEAVTPATITCYQQGYGDGWIELFA
jgi:hypothetical protein